jgi:hypothetical protein
MARLAIGACAMASNNSPNSFIVIRYPLAPFLLMPTFVAQPLCGRCPFADAMEVDSQAMTGSWRVQSSGERNLTLCFALGFATANPYQ